jgi:hypothetical protein
MSVILILFCYKLFVFVEINNNIQSIGKTSDAHQSENRYANNKIFDTNNHNNNNNNNTNDYNENNDTIDAEEIDDEANGEALEDALLGTLLDSPHPEAANDAYVARRHCCFVCFEYHCLLL